MGFSRRESLIETISRQTGWLIALREHDYYKLRPADAQKMHYLCIRCSDESAYAVFRTDLQVQFPVASAPPDLYRMLLLSNVESYFGKWIAELMDSCDIIFYQQYVALKAGLTPSLFDKIGRQMLDERERVHTELREQLSRLHLPPALAGGQVGWQEAGGHALPAGGQVSLPPGNRQAIGWVQR